MVFSDFQDPRVRRGRAGVEDRARRVSEGRAGHLQAPSRCRAPAGALAHEAAVEAGAPGALLGDARSPVRQSEGPRSRRSDQARAAPSASTSPPSRARSTRARIAPASSATSLKRARSASRGPRRSSSTDAVRRACRRRRVHHEADSQPAERRRWNRAGLRADRHVRSDRLAHARPGRRAGDDRRLLRSAVQLLRPRQRHRRARAGAVSRPRPLGLQALSRSSSTPTRRWRIAPRSPRTSRASFWEMHDAIFAKQRTMKREDLLAHAADAGSTCARFTADLDGDKFSAVIARDMKEGATVGVDGTPTFFINGQPVVGAQPFEKFTAAIDKALAAAPPRSRAETRRRSRDRLAQRAIVARLAHVLAALPLGPPPPGSGDRALRAPAARHLLALHHRFLRPARGARLHRPRGHARPRPAARLVSRLSAPASHS